MVRAQIIRMGESLGIVLPEVVIQQLELRVDDTLVIVPTPIGFEFWPDEAEPVD